MRRRLAVASAAVLAITALAACGSDSEPEGGTGSTGESVTASAGEPITGLTVTGEFGEEPTVEVDGLDVDEPQSTVVIGGDGEELTADGAAMTRIFMANGGSGETLASSYEDPEPFKMVVADQPEAISNAVVGQSIGSRVALAMPASELYGDQGSPQLGLAAEDDLVMVLDLVEAVEPPLTGPEGEPVDPPADAPKVIEEDGAVTGLDFSDAPEQAPNELQVITLIEGEGQEVREGDPVTVDYYGAVWGADEPFDESYTAEPASFTLSEGSLIDGWVQGLQGVPVGSRVMLVIPPDLGYGKQGSPPNIPGNSTLVFVVDVLGAGT